MGYTVDDLRDILGDEAETYNFGLWMGGQTMGICDGREYDHHLDAYRTTPCAASTDGGHGAIVYTWDLERYLQGHPVID